MRHKSLVVGAAALVVAAIGAISLGVSGSHSTTVTTSPPRSQVDCKMLGADPDPTCTPGAVNPAVTQANIKQTICKKGWSASVRPAEAYTEQMKKNMMRSGTFTATYKGQKFTYHGYNDGLQLAQTELDHNVPISAAGAVADPRNLFPEPGGTANYPLVIGGLEVNSLTKDHYELWALDQVCSGKITLAQDQAKFLGGHWVENWISDGKPQTIYHGGSNGTSAD